MALSYRKSKSLGNGSRLNVGKRSVGVSTGTKGARFSVNSKGQAGFSFGFPGTGIRYRKRIKIGGGLLGSICSLLVGLFQITALITWWMLKVVIWCMYMLGLYAFKAIRYVVLLIAGKLRKEAPEE